MMKNLKLIKLKDFLRIITSSKIIQKTVFFIFRLRAEKAKSIIARKCFLDILESKNMDITPYYFKRFFYQIQLKLIII